MKTYVRKGARPQAVRGSLDLLLSWGVPTVQYVGGETFMHKGFPEIIRYAKSLGFNQTLITNAMIPGTRIKDHADTLLSFSKIQISMNGVRAEFDRTVGMNAFERFKRAVKSITAIHSNVWLSWVVTETNVHQIPEALETCANLGARGIRLGVLTRQGRGKQGENSYFSCLKTAAKHLSSARVEFPKLAIDCLFDLSLSQNVSGMDVRDGSSEGQGILYINKDAEVYPFPLLELPEFRLGNALGDYLEAIWHNHPVLNTLRSPDTEHPVCKACPKACALRSPSLRYLWTGSFSGKLPCSDLPNQELFHVQ